jgi:molybdate transport system substrate-binding protein
MQPQTRATLGPAAIARNRLAAKAIAIKAGRNRPVHRGFTAIMAITVASAIGLAAPAAAADLSLFASNAINVILEEIIPPFERASGHKVTLRLDVAARLRQDIESGAAFDLAILVGNLDGLVQRGKMATGTPVALGRSGYGLAVRQGAPKPDIATTEAFKQALLKSSSVAYTEGGGSGSYFLGLIDRLGIAAAMQPKLRPGTNTQEAVARGAVEMSVNGIVPILRARGVELAGPLPAELQSYSVFFAGISATTKHNAAAVALLKYLTTPAVVATFKQRGVEAMP